MSYRSNKVQHLYYTLPIVFFSLVFNIPRFFDLKTGMVARNVTVYNETLGEDVKVEVEILGVIATDLRKDPSYSRDYILIANSIALVR